MSNIFTERKRGGGERGEREEKRGRDWEGEGQPKRGRRNHRARKRDDGEGRQTITEGKNGTHEPNKQRTHKGQGGQILTPP